MFNGSYDPDNTDNIVIQPVQPVQPIQKSGEINVTVNNPLEALVVINKQLNILIQQNTDIIGLLRTFPTNKPKPSNHLTFEDIKSLAGK